MNNIDTDLATEAEYELAQREIQNGLDIAQAQQEALDDQREEWPGDDVSEFDGENEPREDHFRNDVEADADALASAGFGTDEDYGYYGE